jgi:hypothetical protein
VGSDLPSTGNCTDIDPDAAATPAAAVVTWTVLPVGDDRSVQVEEPTSDGAQPKSQISGLNPAASAETPAQSSRGLCRPQTV